ncbi:hypothetical protein VTN00DRAFT_4328 [Thermoascus crustaceus]|uniref:uncharacterized protein n=1 Tax=Thermoascus crustaceus TaxID=5088 RepID=UPI003742B1B4
MSGKRLKPSLRGFAAQLKLESDSNCLCFVGLFSLPVVVSSPHAVTSASSSCRFLPPLGLVAAEGRGDDHYVAALSEPAEANSRNFSLRRFGILRRCTPTYDVSFAHCEAWFAVCSNITKAQERCSP